MGFFFRCFEQKRMALSKYDSTRETTNLARIARAILGPCVDVLRDVLTKEITPQDLKKEINKYPDKYRISKHQKQVVNNGDYSKFDISLLYMFLRNLGSIPEHKNKWGTDPDPYDKSVSANIERIRNLRNKWGHFTDLSLSDSDFEQQWKIIFQTVKDLEGYLGATTEYQDALNNLKTCGMDPDSIQAYIKKLLLVEQLVNDLGDLKGKISDSLKIKNQQILQICYIILFCDFSNFKLSICIT